MALSIGAAHAADDAGLRRCRDMAEPAKRLACYDALPIGAPSGAGTAPTATSKAAPAPPGAPPATTAAAPERSPPIAAISPKEAQFGLPQPMTEPPSIESYIPGQFDGWGPDYRIRLANGQVWQIVDGSKRAVALRDPKVSVRRGALGSYFLDIEGDNRSPQVRRVQ